MIVFPLKLLKADLTAAGRKHIKPGNFAIPETKSYPIHDEVHARNALARVAQHGTPEEQSRVRAAVKRKYPHIEQEALAKGGEGSRGGHVIGHTRSGRAIYANGIVGGVAHESTEADHRDAAQAHGQAAAMLVGRGTAASLPAKWRPAHAHHMYLASQHHGQATIEQFKRNGTTTAEGMVMGAPTMTTTPSALKSWHTANPTNKHWHAQVRHAASGDWSGLR